MPYVNNQGTRIHFEVDGQGPPLILQHGFSSNLRSWYKYGYAQELSLDYRLILVDARGHGESDKPHEITDYAAEVVAGDYTAILDELGIEEACFFGYSMGGRIGFQSLARYARSRIGAFVIGGATPYGTRTEKERQEYELRIGGLRLAAEQGMEAYISGFYEKIYGSMSRGDREALLANDPKALYAIRQAYEEWPSSEDILPELKIPILVYCGDRDVRYEMANECVQYLSVARFLPVEGLAHIEVLVQAGRVLPHIKAFLAALG
jgi:pimeloyl-ACP methyl ester carboxylesterase